MVLAQQAQPQQQQIVPQAEATLVLVKPGLDERSRDSDKAMRREMIAFTHATGWIHKEFQKYRAEQIQRTHVYIHIECLDKFIKKCPLAEAHPAKLTVFFDDDYKQGINILPLMEFLQRNPTMPYDIFTLNSQDRTVRDEKIHAMVFGPLRNALVNDPRVLRVSYTCFRHLKTLNVWARSEREEDGWMGNTKEQTWKPEWWNRRSGEGMTEGALWIKAKQGAIRNWLQQAGADLSLLAGWHVTVGS
jgi:hypothetical protein